MAAPRPRVRPQFDQLEARVVLSTTTTLATPTHLVPGEYPSANSHQAFTVADLQAYAAAYETFVGEANFTPQYDFNGTGFIGQNDAAPILRSLAAITPRGPLTLTLALAPGEQVTGSHPSNNGGVTRKGTVTVIGKTTPNSIIFTDGPTTNSTLPTNNFKFQGIAITSNAQGVFTYTATLNKNSTGGSETNTAFLIRTPFGQQLLRSFPIRRLP